MAAAGGDEAAALGGADRALALAAGASTAADVWIPDARAAQARLLQARRADVRARRERRQQAVVAGAAVLAAVLLALARRRWRGRTVAAALRRRPGLFPDVAGAVGELRHDVLKHRAGVLGLIADPGTERAEVARALAAPSPPPPSWPGSTRAWRALARAAGIVLRPLAREPVFGALARSRPGRGAAGPAPVGRGPPPSDACRSRDRRAAARRARADALDGLAAGAAHAASTRARCRAWIAAAEAPRCRRAEAGRRPRCRWRRWPSIFPSSTTALAAIFANLLRNAQTAIAGRPTRA